MKQKSKQIRVKIEFITTGLTVSKLVSIDACRPMEVLDRACNGVKLLSYHEGILWIAENDESAERNVEIISELATTMLLADLFKRTYIEVAQDVLKQRKRLFK